MSQTTTSFYEFMGVPSFWVFLASKYFSIKLSMDSLHVSLPINPLKYMNVSIYNVKQNELSLKVFTIYRICSCRISC